MQADIVIIGGGPVGASLAILTAKAGFETALVDARDLSAAPRPDGRNYAIVRGSWRLLQAVGIADELEPDAQPLNGLEAIDGGKHWLGAPSVLFTNEDLASHDAGGTLGLMVEAGRLQASLDKALAKQKGLTHLAPEKFSDFEATSGGVIVKLESGKEIKAALLVGCDGMNSPVRNAAGIETEGRAYGKSVFAADVALERPHKGIARQLFTPEGPFATLPLTGDRANLAWYMKTGAAETLVKLDVAEIEAELNARFAGFAGKMKLISKPIAYPLILKLATSMIGDRVALLGDAAHRVNPLAGQGLNLGIKDVAALIEVMTDARYAGLDIGAATVLERYKEWRRFDTMLTAYSMDGIERAFSNDNIVLKPLRGLALTAANRIGPIRRAMARQASADQKDLPKLLRGEAL